MNSMQSLYAYYQMHAYYEMNVYIMNVYIMNVYIMNSLTFLGLPLHLPHFPHLSKIPPFYSPQVNARNGCVRYDLSRDCFHASGTSKHR